MIELSKTLWGHEAGLEAGPLSPFTGGMAKITTY